MREKRRGARILIRGGNYRGKGAEAMLLTTKAELERRLEPVQFIAEMSKQNHEWARSKGIQPHSTEWSDVDKCRKAFVLAGSILRHPRLVSDALHDPGMAFTLLHRLKGIDAVVDISGFAYGDDWASGTTASRTSRCARICARTGRAYILMPQAWGPFEDARSAKAARYICRYASCFYARDRHSGDFLSALLDSPTDDIPMADDVAFRFKPECAEVANETLRHLVGWEMGDCGLVGVIPNMRVYERSMGKDSNNVYIRGLVAGIERIRQKGVRVLILPHEFNYSPDEKNDPYLCELLVSLVHDESVKAITKNLPAGLFKAIIGRMEMLVASRYHAIVAALSTRVPCLAIGWSHKYGGLMERVGIKEAVVDHTVLDVERLPCIIDDVWRRRGVMRNRLERVVPDIERNVDRLFDHVAGIITGVCS